MKRLLIFFLQLFFCLSSYSASAVFHKKPADFHEGIVVLHSGDTIHCKLRFTRKVSEGLIQVLKSDHVEILTVKHVHAFSYRDERKKQTRTFYNITITPELSTRKHEVFLELMYANNNFLILNHRTLGYSEKSIQINPFRQRVVVEKHYLFDKRGGHSLPLSRENMLQMLEGQKEEIVSYLETAGLKFRSVDDFINVLDYHQSLH